MTASTASRNTQNRPIWQFIVLAGIVALLAVIALARGTSYQAHVEIVPIENGWAGKIDGYSIKCGPGDFGNHLTMVMGERSFSETNVKCDQLDSIKDALMRILVKAAPTSISQIRAAQVIFAFGKYMTTFLP